MSTSCSLLRSVSSSFCLKSTTVRFSCLSENIYLRWISSREFSNYCSKSIFISSSSSECLRSVCPWLVLLLRSWFWASSSYVRIFSLSLIREANLPVCAVFSLLRANWTSYWVKIFEAPVVTCLFSSASSPLSARTCRMMRSNFSFLESNFAWSWQVSFFYSNSLLLVSLTSLSQTYICSRFSWSFSLAWSSWLL